MGPPALQLVIDPLAVIVLYNRLYINMLAKKSAIPFNDMLISLLVEMAKPYRLPKGLAAGYVSLEPPKRQCYDMK